MGDEGGFDKDKLLENFQFIGHTPGEDILSKCLELCITYKLSEEDLVDQWAAFSLSNYKNATPTMSGLELMERKDLSKNKSLNTVAVKTPEPKKPTINVVEAVETTAMTPKNIRQHPVQSLSQDISNSPASQVQAYSKRPDRGKVLLSQGTNMTFLPCFSHINVKLFGDLPQQGVPIDAKYMFESMNRKRTGISDITTYVANCIAKKQNINLPEKYTKLNFDGEHLYGRIVCDCDAKLNSASVLLELPAGDFSLGDSIPLNVAQVNSYSIFPGQVVIAEGRVIKGTMNVKEIYTNASRKPTSTVRLPESVQIIVASGPFSIKNDLNYEPLQDLLKYVLEKKPHVLILIGPFLDIDNENVDNGSMTESYDSFFTTLVDSIMVPLAETNISVVFVASHKDAHHHVVYPTPPYKLKKKYPNLLCAPDPCLLDIHGLIIGITAVDILFHIGKQELCWPSGMGDRMSRLSQYLLGQMCFYPLYPPEKNNVSIDHSLLEKFGIMETMPHVLLLPSTFRHFVKKLNDCTVINPERLVKGYAGGTFARLNVSFKEQVDKKVQQLTNNHEGLREVRSACDDNVVTLIQSPALAILFLIVCIVLLLLALGIIKGLLGLYCCPPIGMCGLGALIDLPRPLPYYQEPELEEFPVKYDIIGWPVHPQTGKRTVRAISLRTEFCLNVIFFLTYPLVMLVTLLSLCCFSHVYDTDDTNKEYLNTHTIMLTDAPSFAKNKANYKCMKKKQPVYNDDSGAEEADTKYVLAQMHQSEQELKNQNP